MIAVCAGQNDQLLVVFILAGADGTHFPDASRARAGVPQLDSPTEIRADVSEMKAQSRSINSYENVSFIR